MVQPCPCFCFSSRFQLCGFAQRPWADQFCEFGCGTCLVKKDISVSEEGKPNKFANVYVSNVYVLIGDLYSTIGYSHTPKWKKTIYQLKFLDEDTSHWHFGWLLCSGKASNSQTSSATSTPVAPLDCQRHHGRAFQLPQKSRFGRYFEGKINSSPQCFLFKCFHISVLAWFHKFQREGLLRVYLMTSVFSEPSISITTQIPLNSPFIQFYSFGFVWKCWVNIPNEIAI